MRRVEKTERVERGGEKRRGKKKKGGKGVLGNCGYFWFLFDCVFSLHPFLPPFFQSTMPPHSITTLSLTPPQSTPHHTMAHTTRHATTRVCCGVCCLRVSVCPLFPHSTQTTPRHPITPSTIHDATNT